MTFTVSVSRSRSRRRTIGIITLGLALAALMQAARAAEDDSQVEKRLGKTAKYLASDELEGRGLGSKGLSDAANYLAAEFKQFGLKTQLFEGGPFQKLKVTV